MLTVDQKFELLIKCAEDLDKKINYGTPTGRILFLWRYNSDLGGLVQRDVLKDYIKDKFLAADVPEDKLVMTDEEPNPTQMTQGWLWGLKCELPGVPVFSDQGTKDHIMHLLQTGEWRKNFKGGGRRGPHDFVTRDNIRISQSKFYKPGQRVIMTTGTTIGRVLYFVTSFRRGGIGSYAVWDPKKGRVVSTDKLAPVYADED
jgi:hypothetical protein